MTRPPQRFPGGGQSPPVGLKAGPPNIQQLFAAAAGHHQRGDLASAEQLYRRILATDPRHAGSLHYLGVIALQNGHNADAALMLEQSIAARERNPDAHFHRGVALTRLGRVQEAIPHYRRTVALQSDRVDAQLNLGHALKSIGQNVDAAVCFRRVAAFAPRNPDGHFHLGNTLVEQGEIEPAVKAYEKAIAARSDYVEAHANLGTALLLLRRTEDAIASYRRALALKPDFVDAMTNLALALMGSNSAEAAELLCRALDIKPIDEAKRAFVQCVAGLDPVPDVPRLRDHVVTALLEPWGRPSLLTGIAMSLLKSAGPASDLLQRAAAMDGVVALAPPDLAALGGDALLRALLDNAPIPDSDLEVLLTAARFALLALADDAAPHEPAALDFACALASQCFVNEYIYDLTEEEDKRAGKLRDRLAAAIGNGEVPSPLMLATVAAYHPLHGIPRIDRLLSRPWPPLVDALLNQQVRKPQRDAALRPALPRLTAIDDAVSLEVQSQYEENPYPRWVRLARAPNLGSLHRCLQTFFPHGPLRGQPQPQSDILVAGCGTGQFLIELAQSLPQARILAVDLSLASLSYAKSRANELRVTNIEFAQADILKLPGIGRTFDYIESGGVLHHMADPFAAWAGLLTLLRPDGVMGLGFYSEIGRQPIVAARALIAERSLPPTPAGIRAGRAALRALPDEAPAKPSITFGDFFSMSACRDLLFHRHEQRMVLPQIKAFIAEHGLDFLGLRVDAGTLGRYAARFPQDTTFTDLDCWHAFETENPTTFVGMYEIGVQKRG